MRECEKGVITGVGPLGFHGVAAPWGVREGVVGGDGGGKGQKEEDWRLHGGLWFGN